MKIKFILIITIIMVALLIAMASTMLIMINKKVEVDNQNTNNAEFANSNSFNSKINEIKFDKIKLIIIEEQISDKYLQYDINSLKNMCTQEIIELETYFNYKYPHIITVNLHNGPFMAFNHYFRNGGYAKADESLIGYSLTSYTAINGIGKHEFIHLFLSSKHGNSKSRLITEGFAVAVEDILDGVSYARRSINENIEIVGKIDLEQLINKENELNEDVFYPNAGKFLKWIIKTYGIDLAERLYIESTKKKITIELIAKILNINTEYLLRNYN